MYSLGKYRFKNFKIYKRVIGPFYKCIDDRLYAGRQGIVKVNELNGIFEEKLDYSHLTQVKNTLGLKGRYLVNFVEQEGFFGNNALPAHVKSVVYNGDHKLDVQWENGMSCVMSANNLNIYEVEHKK